MLMVEAVGLALIVIIFNGPASVIVISRILAVGSAGLWFAHLGAFALRAARSISKETALREHADSDPSLHARRRFLFALGKSFVFAMTATALPIRSAFAADCPCAAPLKCCWNYDQTNYVCAAADDMCCVSNNPWSCPSGHSCLGDSGGCT